MLKYQNQRFKIQGMCICGTNQLENQKCDFQKSRKKNLIKAINGLINSSDEYKIPCFLPWCLKSCVTCRGSHVASRTVCLKMQEVGYINYFYVPFIAWLFKLAQYWAGHWLSSIKYISFHRSKLKPNFHPFFLLPYIWRIQCWYRKLRSPSLGFWQLTGMLYLKVGDWRQHTNPEDVKFLILLGSFYL